MDIHEKDILFDYLKINYVDIQVIFVWYKLLFAVLFMFCSKVENSYNVNIISIFFTILRP